MSVRARPEVAVVRVLPGLGDLLCAVPALRALRTHWPDAHITWVGATGTQWFRDRFPHYVDAVLDVPAFPGLPEAPGDVRTVAATLAEAQASRFDLALQMHGSGVISNPLTALLGARTMAGHYPAGLWCPDATTFVTYPDTGHEIHRLLGVTQAAGIPDQGDALEFPLLAADRSEQAALMSDGGLPAGPYACVHAGASVAERRWPAEAFAAIADSLVDHGLAVVLTGSAAERTVTAAVARAMRADAVDLAGVTSLGGLAAVLEEAVLVVTNDTGISHLTAAVGTRSVVVFTASDPERWAPLDRVRHRAVDARAGHDTVASVRAAVNESLEPSALTPPP